MHYFGPNSAQMILLNALGALVLMPILGFVGAVFLNWSRLLLDSRPIRYWTAYKINTLGSMAVVVFLVPVQLVTNRLGLLAIVVYFALSIVGLAIFYSRWIRNENDEPLGLEDAFWLSLLQSGLWLLVAGVIFGFSIALIPSRTFPGVALAIVCMALLVGAASMSMRRPERTSLPSSISWKTEDILALHRHAAEEFDRGERDDELWALATIARPDPAQRREWYLAERVKQLREIAEDQLRREGIL